MESKKLMAENNKIIEIITGSNLYGLQTPDSDLDYNGIFMPDKKYVYGFENCEEVDLSIIDKLDSKKNSKDAVDRKFWSFTKYIKLATACNPNIVELLFAPKESIVFINDIGQILLDNSHLFPHKGLKERFVGYAISQKKKMIVKKDTFLELEQAIEFLEKVESKLLLPQLMEYNDFKKLFRYTNLTDEHYKVGDMTLNKNQTVKRAIQKIEERIGEKSNRKELIKERGFDTKFSSHMIRLLIEGKELLETGKLIFPLTNKQEIMDIKLGKWDLQQVLDYADYLESEIEKSVISSELPNEPRVKEIEEFMIKEMELWLSTYHKK